VTNDLRGQCPTSDVDRPAAAVGCRLWGQRDDVQYGRLDTPVPAARKVDPGRIRVLCDLASRFAETQRNSLHVRALCPILRSARIAGPAHRRPGILMSRSGYGSLRRRARACFCCWLPTSRRRTSRRAESTAGISRFTGLPATARIQRLGPYLGGAVRSEDDAKWC